MRNPKAKAVKLSEVAVKDMTRVIREFKHANESKSTGPSKGVMSRRTVRVLSIIHTGKESNKIEDANNPPIITDVRDIRTDYATKNQCVGMDGKPVNLEVIKAALAGHSAREIARMATQLSLSETTNVIEYKKKPSERVQKWEWVRDSKTGEEIHQPMVTITVNREGVQRFLGGNKVRPQTVRLIEKVAANSVVWSVSDITDRAIITPGMILAAWYAKPIRLTRVQEGISNVS